MPLMASANLRLGGAWLSLCFGRTARHPAEYGLQAGSIFPLWAATTEEKKCSSCIQVGEAQGGCCCS